MAIDHSRTYKEFRIKNIPHMLRKRIIIRHLPRVFGEPINRFIDVGCSNGYLTNLISLHSEASNVLGLDHNESNLAVASKAYPAITFRSIDLNAVLPSSLSGLDGVDLITCFETLEHVGDPSQALHTLRDMGQDGTIVFVTVPIESGFIGLIKFTLKTVLYRYSMAELNLSFAQKVSYFRDLCLGRRLAKYRDKRSGWGTHFGFEYREIEDSFKEMFVPLKVYTHFTTRIMIGRITSGSSESD